MHQFQVIGGAALPWLGLRHRPGVRPLLGIKAWTHARERGGEEGRVTASALVRANTGVTGCGQG